MNQAVFVDPSATTPVKTGTGNGTMSAPIVSSATLTESFTVACTVPGGSGVAQFSVVGSVSGALGTATSNVEFVDANRKVRFTITAGGTPWAVADQFTFSTVAGTAISQANFNAHVAELLDTFWKDDFGGGDPTNGLVGELNWLVGVSGSGSVAGSSNEGHPGEALLSTGATSGGSASISLGISGAAPIYFSENFDMTFLVKLDNSDSNTQARVRFGVGTKYIGIIKRYTDTNWFVEKNNDDTPVYTDTGVSTSTAYVKMRIRRINSTDVGLTVGAGSEVVLNSNLPNPSTNAMTPSILIQNNAAANKGLKVDLFVLRFVGLSRGI